MRKCRCSSSSRTPRSVSAASAATHRGQWEGKRIESAPPARPPIRLTTTSRHPLRPAHARTPVRQSAHRRGWNVYLAAVSSRPITATAVANVSATAARPLQSAPSRHAPCCTRDVQGRGARF